jgi:transposase InsO family protein
MLTLLAQTAQFIAFHAILRVVDRASALPRGSTPSEAERLLRENLALKAQVRALVLELKRQRGKRPQVSVRTRAAQVFAYLLTRGDEAFQNYYLSASVPTLKRWAATFRRPPWRRRAKRPMGRPPLAKEFRSLIVTLKTDNPLWGARRIKHELKRMGVAVSEPTIQKVLRTAGLSPGGGRPLDFGRWKSSAQDAMWALDFFVARSAKRAWFSVLLVVDIHTRELIELRACDTWNPVAAWTMRTFAAALSREKRRPAVLVHDHGTSFLGQFERQLRVLEIERRRTPIALPFVNGTAERAIKSVRLDLLNHVRVRDVDELQGYLDEYRRYYNHHRANQALDGATPATFGRDAPAAAPIDLAEVRQRRLVRHSFAHGLLNVYELREDERAAA